MCVIIRKFMIDRACEILLRNMIDTVEEDIINKEGALFDLVKKQINARITHRGVKFGMSRCDKWFHLLPIMLFISSSQSASIRQRIEVHPTASWPIVVHTKHLASLIQAIPSAVKKQK